MSQLPGRPSDGLDKAAIDGGRTIGGPWEIAWATQVGAMHVHRGQLREDAAAVAIGPTYAAVAVSDGHGMSRSFRAHVGSELAVRAALEVAESSVATWSGPGLATADVAQWLRQSYTPTVLQRWRALVFADVVEHPLAPDEIVIAPTEADVLVAYGATLLVALADSERVLAWQLGDGDLLLAGNGSTAGHALAADPQLVGNRTTSLCQPQAQHHVRTAVHELGLEPAVVVLSTDGFANAMLAADWVEQLGVDLHGLIESEGFDAVARELPRWSAEAARASGDDVSIVVLAAPARLAGPPGQPADAAPALGLSAAPVSAAPVPAPPVPAPPVPAAPVPAAPVPAAPVPAQASGARGGSRSRSIAVMVLLLAAAAVGFTLWRLASPSGPSTTSPATSSISTSQATTTTPPQDPSSSSSPSISEPTSEPTGSATPTAGFTRRP